MKRKWLSINRALFLPAIIAVWLAASATAFGAARIVLVNMDNPGVGFNDPTPAAPVGDNRGATVGEQRRIAVQYALDIWGAALDSNVEIRVEARFEPRLCSAGNAQLGQAGPLNAARNFPGAEFPNTWYLIALANKQAGYDLDPENNDIEIYLNNSVGGSNPDGSPCLSGISWYYGLDTKQSPNQVNLVSVVLHELAHGLAFTSLVNLENGGVELHGMDDIFSKYIFDTTIGKHWSEMTDAERMASAVNTRRVVWDGPHVKAAAPNVLSRGMPKLVVNSPEGITGDYVADGAEFGPPLSVSTVTGNVVLANDGDGVATDACSPLRKAPAVSGNIALVDRGNCLFIVKVKNAQEAGAIGVIVADNVANSRLHRMAGDDPTITIRSVAITLADGNRIKAALGTQAVNATLGVDPAALVGADSLGRVLLYTPNPLSLASSVDHWDPVAFPYQLMGPAVPQYLHSVKEPEDLSLALMKDIGWRSTGNRVVRIGQAGGAPGGQASVPVELVAQGDENELGFSLTFDPAVLRDPQAAPGSDAAGATLNVNVSQAASGRLGIALSLPFGQKFSAGARQIVVVNFTIASGANASSTQVGFDDQPVAREISDTSARALQASYSPGAVTLTSGFEGDVAPRPNGNGSVTITDWGQIGRFVAGQDTPAGGEFQRVDTAPRESRGNGSLTITDWVQAGRYAAGLDAPTPAGGPASQGGLGLAAASRQARFAPGSRNVRISNSYFERGQQSSVIIELGAEGNENAVGFSLDFDPAQLRFVSAATGRDSAGATLNVNTSQASKGSIGLALALPAGQTIPAGQRQIIVINFAVVSEGEAPAATLNFGDQPVIRELSDANANSLPASFKGGAPQRARSVTSRQLSTERWKTEK